MRWTPLHSWHVAHGGRMVDFAGWDLPVQYDSIVAEHRAVRTAAGLFDVSHMGEIRVVGQRALALIQQAVTNDASRLEPGAALYTPMCLPSGGVIDDLLVYRLAEADFLLVVNAANTARDLTWLLQLAEGLGPVRVEDQSDQFALLSLQGPLAEDVLAAVAGRAARDIGRFRFATGVDLDGATAVLVARTGYTGEDGFEFLVRTAEAVTAWETVMAAGEGRVRACGLGARDTLRLEARLPLYGHELSEATTPLEAGLGVFVKLDKPDFVGKAALLAQRQQGLGRKLAGFVMRAPGVPRAGYTVLDATGQPVGTVTSGGYAPWLESNLGLTYLPSDLARPGTAIAVDIRGKATAAEVVRTPFYRREARS